MSEQIITKTPSQCKYQQTKKGKATSKRYNQSEKGKTAASRYWQSEKGKVVQKHQRQTNKYKLAVKRFWERNKGKAAEYTQNYKIKYPGRVKARQVVNDTIRAGKLPRPDILKCSCGEQAKEYHHHKGYEVKHHLDVIPLCAACHIS